MTTILAVLAAGVLCGCAVATMLACLRIWPDEVNLDELHKTTRDDVAGLSVFGEDD